MHVTSVGKQLSLKRQLLNSRWFELITAPVLIISLIHSWISPEYLCCATVTFLTVCVCVMQGGQWISWCHAARLGHWFRSVFTRPHGPRGGSALRPVWRATGGQRCLRLHGESLGPRDGDLPPHAARPHKQSVLITGEASHSIKEKTGVYQSTLEPNEMYELLCFRVFENSYKNILVYDAMNQMQLVVFRSIYVRTRLTTLL